MTLSDISQGNVPEDLRPLFADLKGKTRRTIRRRVRDLVAEGRLVLQEPSSESASSYALQTGQKSTSNSSSELTGFNQQSKTPDSSGEGR